MTTAPKIATRKRNETALSRADSGQIYWSIIALTLAGISFGAIPSALAEGFRNSPAGSFDLSRAGGRIAQVDDSTAVLQNPANLVDVPGTELNLTPTVIYIHVDYKSPTGVTEDTRSPWKILPNFTASRSFHNGDYAIGFGVSVPYGISTEWNSEFGGLFHPSAGAAAAPYFSELKTINLSPAFSVKISEHLKLGLGLDIMWSHLRLNQFLNGFPSLEGEAVGTGYGYGANAGLTWQITDNQRLALTYRSPMTVSYGGDFRLTGLANASTTFNSQIAFPTIISLGYGFRASENVRIESDLEWIEFSRFQNLPISVGANPFVPSQNIAEHWKNTFTAGISADWMFAPDWTLRGGYQFYESPVPDNTYSPLIPDANQNVITIGINYKHKHQALEFAYGLDFYDHRNITGDQNPAFNGSYDVDVHLFSFSYRYSF